MVNAERDNPQSEKVQGRDKSGNLKWSVMLVVEFEAFGQTKHDTINVTLTSKEKPCQGIQPGSKVVIERLVLGVMPQKGGVSAFYSANAIKPDSPVNVSQATSPYTRIGS
jgi:hypothetical protein